MNLAEVLRLLSSSNQTGALIISFPSTDETAGSIYMNLGQLVHSASTALHGMDALFQICEYLDADFKFEPEMSSFDESLSAYPTPRLLEKIQKRVLELKTFRDSIPNAEDIPTYVAGKAVENLQADPEELAILLLCQNELTVKEIANQTNQNLKQVCATLGKFRQKELLEIQVSKEKKVEEKKAKEKVAVVQAPKKKPVRYWRGKRIE